MGFGSGEWGEVELKEQVRGGELVFLLQRGFYIISKEHPLQRKRPCARMYVYTMELIGFKNGLAARGRLTQCRHREYLYPYQQE